MERKTALYEQHLEAGGKLVPYAGYLLPIEYTSGMAAEHLAVRERAGLFDVSHMGEFFVSGETALAYLEHILARRISKTKPGRVVYSVLCAADGNCLDDLLVYRLSETAFMVVVNAANREKDKAHFLRKISPGTVFEDRSDETGLIALQGPYAKRILERLADGATLPERFYSFVEHLQIGGCDCLVSRTGYTGEYGYELYHRAADSPALWKALFDAAEEGELIPCGLGARDTLRLEAGMPLYGHEMDETINPLEAGLDYGVTMEKDDFIGKKAIELSFPLTRQRVGLVVTGRGIVREGATIYVEETDGTGACVRKPVGRTTSGTFSPYLKKSIAMGYISPEYCAPGRSLLAEVRGRMIPVEEVELPFVKR